MLAFGYLVLLVIRFSTVTSALNTNEDFGAAWVLATAVSNGHAGGEIVLGTQGAWAPLAWGVLTHSLPLHRTLWEISPAIVSLICALVVGWSTGRVGGRAAGWLAVALIVAASPTTLWILSAPWLHNTTFIGTAMLGAYLAWLTTTRRSVLCHCAVAVVLSIVIGVFMASDELLEPTGFIPFLLAPAVIALRTRDARGLTPVVPVAAGAALIAVLTNAGMHAAHFVTLIPSSALDTSHLGQRFAWLAEGIGRLGNGVLTGSVTPARMMLTLLAALVEAAALVVTARLAGRSVYRPGSGPERARALYITFWSGSALCASAAYLLTGVASIPADRYVLGVILALAAIIPLRLARRPGPVLIGASIVMVASIVGLACGDISRGAARRVDGQEAHRVAALVAREHLGVGYGGYSLAGPLDWNSGMRLQIHPVEMFAGRLQPMNIARVNAWYRPRRHTPSYLVIAPQDLDLPDSPPPQLGSPMREYRVGRLTILAYRYDIADALDPPLD